MDDQTHTYHVNIKRLDGGNWSAECYANAVVSDAELAASKDPLAMVREAVHRAVDDALDEVGPPNG